VFERFLSRCDAFRIVEWCKLHHWIVVPLALCTCCYQSLTESVPVSSFFQLHPACEAASSEQRVLRPLPPQPQLAAQVAGRVAGWSKMRVRDELGLDKMLAEDAKVGDCC
jgi:hypothetical protein